MEGVNVEVRGADAASLTKGVLHIFTGLEMDMSDHDDGIVSDRFREKDRRLLCSLESRSWGHRPHPRC